MKSNRSRYHNIIELTRSTRRRLDTFSSNQVKGHDGCGYIGMASAHVQHLYAYPTNHAASLLHRQLRYSYMNSSTKKLIPSFPWQMLRMAMMAGGCLSSMERGTVEQWNSGMVEWWPWNNGMMGGASPEEVGHYVTNGDANWRKKLCNLIKPASFCHVSRFCAAYMSSEVIVIDKSQRFGLQISRKRVFLYA